jgi:hypothetical protein
MGGTERLRWIDTCPDVRHQSSNDRYDDNLASGLECQLVTCLRPFLTTAHFREHLLIRPAKLSEILAVAEAAAK